MAKFKVGDRVRCIDQGGSTTILNGETYEVIGIGGAAGAERLQLKETPANNSIGWFSYRFELADPSELEQLVATANAGRRAVDTLIEKYRDQIEICERAPEQYTTVGDQVLRHSPGFEYRVKSQPAFQPFAIGQGWKVEMRGTDRVAVGCQEFGVSRLRGSLAALINENFSVSHAGPLELRATKTGIWTNSGSITWDEATRLLEVLRGVK